ncbi:hypothetical protein GBA77_01745 [Bifidobacterium bifidum]|uniref:Oligopeptide/dipeptide ABC transporter C-terminal domain-containing protein n=2 Tax=Bifidobacterium TaxID=1678 RepID=A0A7J5TQH7_BIFBI|nr:hypothetical protein GBA75_01725 [Bifidobacterium bifidum]KAB5605207.1 hypothetical protein GBA76_01725 [Bifidobacterium bifidum]KAB7468152.1 hypothetical protein GBA85_01745 [Bifidobacterium bifidum]KAB7471025.1 hypothetical protein GBA88_03870 [Bifidobacterium bifidum]KAB7473090.1 hypothetical protein GBA82_01755 [Bifidobacterium bifidum]
MIETSETFNLAVVLEHRGRLGHGASAVGGERPGIRATGHLGQGAVAYRRQRERQHHSTLPRGHRGLRPAPSQADASHRGWRSSRSAAMATCRMEPCQRTDHRLDVTIQAQILDLLMSLKDEYGLSALFITHDFGVVAQIAGKVAVMYAGRLLETGDVYDVFDHPAHPYTAGLLKTRPVIGRRVKRLYSLHDQFPDPAVFGRGTSRAGRAAPRTG